MVSVVVPDSVKSPDTAPVPAAAATVTVTAALDEPDRVAVTVETPPDSVIDVGDSTSDTVGRASSSSKVRVASGGFDTLLPPAAVPETVTDLFGESTVLPFAVTVTAPVLAVAPAAMVRVVPERVKSAAIAPAPAATATVTVTASLDLPESVAVTVETPPVSEIDESESTSDTVGRASSSVMVSVALGGFAAPLPPAAVPDTVTDLFGESVSFPFAATVTVPVLAVAPAAMVRVVPERAKSAATAPAPAAAATATVTASLDLPESVAVTVETPPVSETDAGDSTSDTVGSVSSSVSLRVAPVTVPAPWPLVSTAVTVAERPAEP